MSSVGPVSPTEGTPFSQPAAPSADGSAAAVSGGSSQTSFSTMGELAKEAPQVARAMVEGIAYKIIHQMKDAEARRKKINQEAQRR